LSRASLLLGLALQVRQRAEVGEVVPLRLDGVEGLYVAVDVEAVSEVEGLLGVDCFWGVEG